MWRSFIRRQEVHEAQLHIRVAAVFRKQRTEVLIRLSDALKAVKTVIDENRLVDIDVWNEYMVEAGEQVIASTIIESGDYMLQQLGRDAAMDMARPPVVEFIDKTTKKFAAETNRTTVEALKMSLQDGVSGGESIPDLRKRVEKIFDVAEKKRATMIARSETIRASNFGAEESMVQSGVVEGKEWLTAFDDRTCPFCEEMDGKVMDLGSSFLDEGASFTVGEQTLNNNYTDVGFPPLHPNCRCTIIPVVVEGVDVSEPELPELPIPIETQEIQ